MGSSFCLSRVDLAGVHVGAGDLVAGLGQTGADHETHVPGTDDPTFTRRAPARDDVPSIDDQAGMLGHRRIVDAGVVGDHDDAIGAAQAPRA